MGDFGYLRGATSAFNFGFCEYSVFLLSINSSELQYYIISERAANFSIDIFGFGPA
jgi:hypothetical protein